MRMDKCPKCLSDLSFDEVDIGVGIQIGNLRCDYCGWTQSEDLDKLFKIPKEPEGPILPK